MKDCNKIEFEFPLNLTEKKEEKGKFIFEGIASANDFDLQNDIISDEALRKSIDDFKKNGKFCINHTEEEIGKLIDCHFKKGKIWVKTEVTKKSIVEKVKSGELNCLSIKGQVMKSEKVELLPDLRLLLIKEMHLIEVSLVPQGANPEAKAIRWYVTKAIKMAEASKAMKKDIDLKEETEDFEAVTAGEDEETLDTGEETPETEEEKTEEETPEETKVEETEEKEEEKTELAEEKIVYSVMNSGKIELSEKKDLSEFSKELLRVGKWQHGASSTGVLDVTKEMLKTIIKNFKDKVLDNVFVPLGHPTTDDPSKNVGEVADLELSKSGNELIAKIDVKDETVAEKVKKGLIKGISASFAENYTKKDTGEQVGPTLFHAAMVNEPYIKGMESFVPLSDDLKDSKIIHITNLEMMAEKIQKLEEKIDLYENENKDTSEETSEEVTPEEAPKEETPKEEAPEAKPSEEETSKEDDSKKPESPEVGKEAKDEEEEEVEESPVEETESKETDAVEEVEDAEADEGVELAEAEGMFKELLRQGKVTPAEKDLLLPLLASNTPVELADGKKVDLRKAMKGFLKSRSPIFSLEEFGAIGGDKKSEEEIPDDVNDEMDKMGLSDDKDVRQEAYAEFKKNKEKGGKMEETESTPF